MRNNKQESHESYAEQEDEIDLAEYFGVLLEGKWLIIGIGFVAALMAGLYAQLATPVYQADVLLQVEEKQAPLGGGDLLDLLESSGGSTATEIEIMRSRSVMGQVVDDLQLDIVVMPKQFPVVGGYFLRSHQDEDLRLPVLGLQGYAWGGESIRVDQFDVSEHYVNRSFMLRKLEDQYFQLLDNEEKIILQGEVGKLAVDSSQQIRLFVSELTAHAGTSFVLLKQRKEDVIASYLRGLSIAEKGKGTGIVSLAFSNASPALTQQFLDSLANHYLRQNVERKSEQAKLSLAFLQHQLPQVRGQLEAAETRMNEYRLQSGSVNLSIETQTLLSQVVVFDKELSALDMERTDLSQRFTDNHPLMQALTEKYQRLLDEKGDIELRVKRLPETEQELLTLMRDVKVNTELYTFLLNKSQELKVVEASTVGNVRILDYAVLPYEPIKPKKSMIVALGLMLGLFLGIVFVFVRKAMHQGIEDPNLVERKLGISVFATIPRSDLQVRLHKTMRQGKGENGEALLSEVDNTDLAIESLRSLRTNLHFALMEAPNNIVMLTGPAPGLGKSFVSANFAAVLASSGQRVLLIDGDIRKGHLHEYFGLQRKPGLSGYIAGNVTLEDAIHTTSIENLSVIPTGVLPPNPADLLMSNRFDELLDQLAQSYDLVLIDTPPVLAVTDAVLIGRRAGVSFMLLRSGKHPMREIEQAVKHIEQAGIELNGFIFNDMMPKRSLYGYGNYHYQYAYKKED
ncbi:MAG: polysaccharide biosynthesis tyrosine autokinase [Ghiorsea sp.]|nr:polysaccharide biosynthesis tyrosine autokinase [Ghiorsea sp.]